MQTQQPISTQGQTPPPSDQKKQKKAHHLRYSDFEFIKVLGMGAYGKVQLVQRKGIKYALKIIEKRLLAKEGKEYQAFVERELLRRMDHQGVVALKTCFQDRQNLYFCLEFCQGGDFNTFIQNNFARMTNQLKVFYVAEIVCTIQYFQKIGIVHRDLKPQNILLNQKGHLKIVDFATAQVSQCNLVDAKFKQQLTAQKKSSQQSQFAPFMKMDSIQKTSSQISQNPLSLASSTPLTPPPKSESSDEQPLVLSPSKQRRKATFVGTCYYLPPQLLQNQVCYPATDIWALGCITYQLFYNSPPFDGISEFQIFQKIKNIDYQLPKRQNVSEDAMDFIRRLLRREPGERLGSGREGLGMAELKGHRFFKGIDFQGIFQRQVPMLMEDENEDPAEREKEKMQKLNTFVMKKYLNVLEESTHILTHGVIEKRTFISYNVYYLIVFNNLKMLRIKVIQPGKTRVTDIELQKPIQSKDGLPAQQQGQNFFKLHTKQKMYKLKTHEPTKWTNIINKRYKNLKERDIKMCQNEIRLQNQQIQKQLNSISEALRLIKVNLEQW